MKSSFTISILLMFAVAKASPSASADVIINPVVGTGNFSLVPNGNFENGLDGWVVEATYHPGHYEATQDVTIDGAWTAKSVPEPGTSSPPGYGFTLGQVIPFVAGQQYVVSGYIDASRLGPGDHANVDAWFESLPGSSASAISGLSGLQFVYSTFTAPSTNYAYVRINRDQNVQTGVPAYYDDIAITPVAQFTPPTGTIILHTLNLSQATVPIPTSTPNVTNFPAPNQLLYQMPNFMYYHSSEFSTPARNDISMSTELLGALADPLSNKFLKDFASAAGQNLQTAGKYGSLALAATNPNPLAAEASLSVMLLQETTTIDTTNLKAALSMTSMQSLINYAWGTSGGEPFHAAASLVNFSYGTLLAQQLKVFGNDPIDPNYQSIITPVGVPTLNLPSTGHSNVDAMLSTSLVSITSATSYLQAANETLDRYAGALQANDAPWATMQMDAFLQYLTMYNDQTRDAKSDIDALNSLMLAEGMTNPVYDPQGLLTLQQGIAANGLSADTTSLLLGMGLSSADVDQVKLKILSLDPNSISGDQSASLSDAATALGQVSTVPEPTSLALLGIGIASFLIHRRRCA